MNNNKAFLIILFILNSVVLLGQLWPAGAPPFANYVNIVTLLINLVFIINILKTNRKPLH